MAFDELGSDPSRQAAQDYAVSATGLVSRSFSVWGRQLIQYIIIVGIIGAVTTAISFLVLFAYFETIGILAADPLTYIFSIYSYTTFPGPTLILVSLLFAVVVFIINAIVGGAAIKFALDDYNAHRGNIRTSFSHSVGKVLNFIAVQLVISFLTTIFLFPGLILFTGVLESIDISDPFNPIIPPGAMESLMIGSIFFLIGTPIMIYLSARLSPTVAIVIDTDFSAFGSLKKSWEITSGNVWHVIGGRILFGIAVIVLGGIISLFAIPLAPYNVVIENIAMTFLFGALNYIFPVVLYRDLSSRAKSSSLEELLL